MMIANDDKGVVPPVLAASGVFANLGDLALGTGVVGDDEVRLAFLDRQGGIESSLTTAQLKAAVIQAAGGFQNLVRLGQVVVLVGLEGRSFVDAFFGCILAGAVPAPIQRPRHPRDEAALRRLHQVVGQTNTPLVICEEATQELLEGKGGQCEELLPLLRTPEVVRGIGATTMWEPVAIDPDSTAYFQFTSGSTSEPSGVVLTHRNVLANLACMAAAFRCQQPPRVVGWLPPHHDMGLSGHLLMPLFLGGFSAVMSPATFLRDPGVWLRSIHRYRATSCAAPPFAYDLCVRRKVHEDPALDLSSWTHAFVGAEMVSPDVLERFTTAFAARGFRRESLRPCYGLAEASLFVAGGNPGWFAKALPSQRSGIERPFIGYSFDPAFVDVRVVSPTTKEITPPGTAGEVWISGDSVSTTRQTAQGRQATIVILPGSDKAWAPTGDWGLMDEGKLFILGRSKDLIIIRGTKHAAEELEFAIQGCHPALLPGQAPVCIPLFQGDGEGFIVVQETSRDLPEVTREKIRTAIVGVLMDYHDANPVEVLLIPAGTLPRTANGKISRGLCHEKFAATLEATSLPQASPVQDADVGISELEDDPVVIVGIACRFPGADGPAAFWDVLAQGLDVVTEVPPERWDNDLHYDSRPAVPGKLNTKWGGFVGGIDQFDPTFFGISAREAVEMDPQQRLLLETAWRLFENTGLTLEAIEGSRTGVFVGISTNDYLYTKIKVTPGMESFDAYTGLGNANSIAANRLSYLFDLRGPSLAVDTACSSSMTAFHMAVESVRRGECSQAIVGGANAILSPGPSITLSQFGMMSPDGRCKTFDASADGYVRAEGCGLVMLQRRSEAVREGRRILACVRATDLGQDGRSTGITAPNGAAQRDLLQRTLRASGLKPEQVAYVEAHGTGTAAGDPVEVAQIRAVYGMDVNAQPCFVGSVKASIGHLEAAAGIASIIKAVLVLQHGEAPPQLHVRRLNPKIDLKGSRLEIPAKLTPLSRPEGVRCVAVSSFGFGGANAHAILSEAPSETAKAIGIEVSRTFKLSGKSDEALRLAASAWLAWLKTHPDCAVEDVCREQAATRTVFSVQKSWEINSREELVAHLRSLVEPGTEKQVFEALSGAAPLPRWNGSTMTGGHLDLPGHPFLRRRYWIANGTAQDLARVAAMALPVPENKPTVSAATDSASDAVPSWCLGFEWAARPFKRSQRWPQTMASSVSHWILVGMGGVFGRALASSLRAAKQPVFWIGGESSVPGVTVRPMPEGGKYFETLQHIITKAASEGASAWKVIHLGGLSISPVASLSAAALDRDMDVHGPGDVVRLTQAVVATARVPQLWIVTSRAQSVKGPDWQDDDKALAPAQAPLWGLGRTLFLEHPELRGGLVDLDLTNVETAAENLIWETVDPEGEHAVAFRSGSRYVAQLAPLPPAAPKPVIVRGDGACVVTGGLGGLGLLTAQRLVEQGVRDVVLVGRRTPPMRDAWSPLDAKDAWSPVIQAIQGMEALGAKVEIAAMDVRDHAALEALFARLKGSGRPIRAVVHAAGVNWVGKVRNVDVSELLDSMKIKVSTAWKLHELTCREDLDCFVLFSSVAAIWGSVSLSHYTAANRFLDSLAMHRAANGLPAVSIAWGPWAEAGMSAKPESSDLLEKLGLNLMPPAAALNALDHVSSLGQPFAIVADIAWQRFQTFMEFSLSPSLSGRVAPAALAQASDTASGSSDGGASESGSGPLATLEATIRRALGSVMLVESGVPVDLNQRFNLLGMDSLMAIGFAAELERVLHVPLPITIAYNYPTIRAIRDHLHGLLAEAGRLPEETSVPEAPAPPSLVEASTSWYILPEKHVSALPRLYCFPGAGGGASYYAGWVEAASSWAQVVPANFPGREELASLPPLRSLRELVNGLADALPQDSGPFAFHGYSLGALTAFELCHELRRRGRSGPSHLFLSGCGVPLPEENKNLRLLPDELFLDALLDHVGEVGIDSDRRAFARSIFPLLRADTEVLETAVLTREPLLNCPLTVLAGEDDPLTPRESIMRWGALTTSDFALRRIPGGHDFPKRDPRLLLKAIHTLLSPSHSVS